MSNVRSKRRTKKKKEGPNITGKPGGHGKSGECIYNRGRWSLKLSREEASV